MVASYGTIPHAKGVELGKRSRRIELVAVSGLLLTCGVVAFVVAATDVPRSRDGRSVLIGWTKDSDETDTAKISSEEVLQLGSILESQNALKAKVQKMAEKLNTGRGSAIRFESGPPSAQGPQGPRGPPGIKGPDGVRGPQGEVGPAGDQGSDGVQGAQGPRGAPGARGPRGPQGMAGEPGPEGGQGDQGPAGDQGPPGDTGPTGARGIEQPGRAGPPGPIGPVGAPGPAGPPGAQGARGPMQGA